jgi:hypothetical protein
MRVVEIGARTARKWTSARVPRALAGLVRAKLLADILPDEKKESAVAFPVLPTYYQGLGITVARVMTDNGSYYRSGASVVPAATSPLRHESAGSGSASYLARRDAPPSCPLSLGSCG